LRLKLGEKGYKLAAGALDQDGAILPDPIQMLELPKGISLVEVNVMDA
jgi:hypothetical protein